VRFTRIRVHVVDRPRMGSTITSAGRRCGTTSGWRAFHRSSPSMASPVVAARAISIRGTVVRRRPVGPLDLPGAGGGTAPSSFGVEGIRRRDGWTRGGSPGCFAYCGGHGASPRPCASCSAESSSSASSDPAEASIPSDGSPMSANRAGTESIVNASGTQPATSSQRSGVETRASGVGRTE
jgi:hypothetical protein